MLVFLGSMSAYSANTIFTTNGNQGAFNYRQNTSFWVGGVMPPSGPLQNGDIVNISSGDIVTRGITLTGGQSNVLNVYGTFIINGDLDLNNTNNLEINIFGGGSLTVTGNLITKNNAIFVVNSTGSFNIGGALSIGQNTDATINGVMNVAGSTTIGDNAIVNIGSSGYLDVNGTFTAGSNIDLTVNGTLDIAGAGTVGSYKSTTLTGTGTIAFEGTTCGNLNCPTGCTTTAAMTTLKCSNFFSVLPVLWDKIVVSDLEEDIFISWGTFTEKNNAYFEIERSVNSFSNWEVVGQVKGSGTTDSRSSYSFVDYTKPTGIIYFRIKQVDYDGHYDYSSIVYIKCKNNIILGVYPNPNSGVFTLNLGTTDISSISLTTSQGIDINVSLKQTESGFEVEANNIQSGIYTLNVISNGQVYKEKIMIE